MEQCSGERSILDLQQHVLWFSWSVWPWASFFIFLCLSLSKKQRPSYFTSVLCGLNHWRSKRLQVSYITKPARFPLMFPSWNPQADLNRSYFFFFSAVASLPTACIHPLSCNVHAAPFHIALGGWVVSLGKVEAWALRRSDRNPWMNNLRVNRSTCFRNGSF